MKDGDKFRLRGSAGAPFMVTVGRAFTADEIQQRLDSKEWALLDEITVTPPSPEPSPEDPGQSDVPAVDPARPAVNAAKSEWIAYVVARGQLSADDAANYTKADLIDLAN